MPVALNSLIFYLISAENSRTIVNMNSKNKIFIVSVFVLTAVYVILSLSGFAGIASAPGGLALRAVTLAVLVYICVHAFRGALSGGDSNAALTGALGLGTLAVSEVYAFCYIYLQHGSARDITLGNYSRNCAYLFFIASLICLIPDTLKSGRLLRISANALSPISILLIFYGVITGNPHLLYYSALLMMVLCVLPAVVLLISGEKKAKAFSLAIITLSILDSLNRLLIIFDPGWHWRDMIIALYPAVYLFAGFALPQLKMEEQHE